MIWLWWLSISPNLPLPNKDTLFGECCNLSLSRANQRGPDGKIFLQTELKQDIFGGTGCTDRAATHLLPRNANGSLGARDSLGPEKRGGAQEGLRKGWCVLQLGKLGVVYDLG